MNSKKQQHSGRSSQTAKPKAYRILTNLMPIIVAVCVTGVGYSCTTFANRNKPELDVFSAYRENVKGIVPDSERRDALIILASTLHKDLTVDMDNLREIADEIHALRADYGSTRKDIEASLQKLNKHRIQMRERSFSAREAALKLTTPEEWAQLSSQSESLMSFVKETPGLL